MESIAYTAPIPVQFGEVVIGGVRWWLAAPIVLDGGDTMGLTVIDGKLVIAITRRAEMPAQIEYASASASDEPPRP